MSYDLPTQGACTCGSVYGCYQHGPQPREHAVICRKCPKGTFALDGWCTEHRPLLKTTQSNLGCATTRELLEELAARMGLDLDYRTVDKR
jgi:hypothetical protein